MGGALGTWPGRRAAPVPPRLLRAALHLGCEAFSVGPCSGGCPAAPHPLLSVCGVGEPTPASCQGHLQWSCSSLIVFSLGWWPCQRLRPPESLERDSRNLEMSRRRILSWVLLLCEEQRA